MNKKIAKQRQEYYENPFALPPECNILCLIRPCFHKHENKGSFQPGRGYIEYSDDFKPACATRLRQGCPSYKYNEKTDILLIEEAKLLIEKKGIPQKIKKELKEVIDKTEKKRIEQIREMAFKSKQNKES